MKQKLVQFVFVSPLRICGQLLQKCWLACLCDEVQWRNLFRIKRSTSTVSIISMNLIFYVKKSWRTQSDCLHKFTKSNELRKTIYLFTVDSRLPHSCEYKQTDRASICTEWDGAHIHIHIQTICKATVKATAREKEDLLPSFPTINLEEVIINTAHSIAP